jgi:hypothetical protein
MRKAGELGLAVADRFEDWRDEKTRRLETRLREVDALAAAGELPEASLTEEGLSISPIRKNENEAADTIIRRLYAMLPRLRVTELLAEVHAWTGFADRFAHLRTGAPPDDARLDDGIARRRHQSRSGAHGPKFRGIQPFAAVVGC